MCVGSVQSVWAIFYAQAASFLTVPLEFVKVAFGDDVPADKSPEDYVLGKIIITVIAAVVIATWNGVGFFCRNFSFGTLAENVVVDIRKNLYSRILEMNIGWFDDRKHATSVLTSTMAEETARINEASTTSLQPLVTACFSILFGIIVSSYFCWPMALGGLAIAPF